MNWCLVTLLILLIAVALAVRARSAAERRRIEVLEYELTTREVSVGAECRRRISVVGEYYRSFNGSLALREAAADGYSRARLVPEPDNPHDHNAVQVLVGVHHVGYLSREQAKKYRRALAVATGVDRIVCVRCHLTEDYKGIVQTTLFLPAPETLQRELESALGVGSKEAPDESEASRAGA